MCVLLLKCLFVCLSVCLTVCLSVCFTVCFTVCLSVCLSYCLSVCLTVCLTICLSVYLSVCLSYFLSVCLYVCLSVCLSYCLSVCLSVCLTVCLSVLLSVCLSVLLSILYILSDNCSYSFFPLGLPGTGKSTAANYFRQGARKRQFKIVHVQARQGDEIIQYGTLSRYVLRLSFFLCASSLICLLDSLLLIFILYLDFYTPSHYVLFNLFLFNLSSISRFSLSDQRTQAL